MPWYCIEFDIIAVYCMSPHCILWYCMVLYFFGFIARYHTVIYRCYSAPANYRVVHIVILDINEVWPFVFGKSNEISIDLIDLAT